MKTNSRDHRITSLTNRVLAVVDTVEDAEEMIRQLDQLGVAGDRVWALRGSDGVERLDVRGQRATALGRLLRALQSLSTEGAHLRAYEDELRHGHLVLDIPAVHGAVRRRVADRLRRLGAHFINAYGALAIEPVTA